jgi:glycine oxidase
MTFDVAVIGGGIIGTAVAREVARAGLRVVVIERDEPRRHASWAAAGMLAPHAEADRAAPFFSLLLQAREMFPAFVVELERETGARVHYRSDGMLLVALTDADEEELERRLAWQTAAGLAVERISGSRARELEPIVGGAVRWSLRFPGDHQVDNRHLLAALTDSARRAGVEFRFGFSARAIEPAGGQIRVAAEPVAREPSSGTSSEESRKPLVAETVVLAGGSWSGALGGLPRNLPVEPVHGELVSIGAASLAVEHLLASPRCYLVPRDDGRVIVGATSERRGFRVETTPVGLERLTSAAFEIAPTLVNLPITDHWAGLRPGTPDNLPILGRDPLLPSLVYATGHYRNGILLGPLTGKVVAELILGREPPIDLAPYRVERF